MKNKSDAYEKRWQKDKPEIEKAFIEILFVPPTKKLWKEIRKVRDYDNWSEYHDAQQQFYRMNQKSELINLLRQNKGIDDIDKLEIHSKKGGKHSFTSEYWLKFFLQEFFDIYGGKSDEDYEDDQEQTALPAGARKPKKSINIGHEVKFYTQTAVKLFRLLNDEYAGYAKNQFYLLIGIILMIRGHKLQSRTAGKFFDYQKLTEDDRKVITSRVKTWFSRGTQ